MKFYALFSALTLASTSALAQPPAAPQPPSPAAMADMFIQHQDADKNGSVSKAEFMRQHEDQFKSMDANADGQLDKAEVEKFASEMQKKMDAARAKMGQPQPTK